MAIALSTIRPAPPALLGMAQVLSWRLGRTMDRRRVNKSKNIGTAAESAVRDVFRANGFHGCERRALNGSTDLGDLTGIGPLVVEVKAGAAAVNASDGLVREWLAQTERERINADADFGLLVMKRAGIGPTRAGEWWTVLPMWQVLYLHGTGYGSHFTPTAGAPVRLHLTDAITLLRLAGYGDALDTDKDVA